MVELSPLEPGDTVCLGYRWHTFDVGLPAWLIDDGYVIHYVGQYDREDEPLSELDVAQLQADGWLPDPLPPYAMPWWAYVGGFSLWWVLAIGAVVTVAIVRGRRRRARIDAETPVADGPPALLTDGDRFIHGEVEPLLRDGERITHQAYTLDSILPSFTKHAPLEAKLMAPQWDPDVRFAVLTTERLLLVHTRVGRIKSIIYENHGVDAYELGELVAARRNRDAIDLRLGDGTTLRLVVHDHKHLSNQAAFRRDLPRIIAARIAAIHAAAAQGIAPP